MHEQGGSTHTELTRSQWEPVAQAHRARAQAFIDAHLERKQTRVKHPVHDFLFTYYSYRPAQLATWHPGWGVRLLDAPEYDGLKGYADGAVSPAFLVKQQPVLRSVLALMRATAGREANFGCFGLHEWAMVHRLSDDATRHADWPLRLGGAGTDQVVESHRIACSHFDAYRFFTPTAVEFNTLRPTAADRPAFEQPACLHGNMDLYKHAFRLSPLIASDVVLRAFELAREIRALDMRASPYDLSGLPEVDGEDWTPVRIETADGKREYATAQASFAERARPIRAELIAWCERLLAVTT